MSALYSITDDIFCTLKCYSCGDTDFTLNTKIVIIHSKQHACVHCSIHNDITFVKSGKFYCISSMFIYQLKDFMWRLQSGVIAQDYDRKLCTEQVCLLGWFSFISMSGSFNDSHHHEISTSYFNNTLCKQGRQVGSHQFNSYFVINLNVWIFDVNTDSSWSLTSHVTVFHKIFCGEHVHIRI